MQLVFNIKMSVIAPDDVNGEEKSPRMPNIKLANEQPEGKRVKTRKRIKNLRSQLTSETKCWKKVVEKFATMDSLTGSQKAHLKSTCDLPTENINKFY